MAATDIFVKTGGNDGNSGLTWALAKATIQAGLNVVPDAGGGHRVIVAPGIYSTGTSIGSNAYAGADQSTGVNTLIGDTESNIADGGAATSGVTPGYVSLQKHASNNVSNRVFYSIGSATWNYWDFKGIVWVSYADAFRGFGSEQSIRMYDCVFMALGISPACFTWKMDTGKTLEVHRSYFYGSMDGSSVFSVSVANSSMSGSPDVNFYDCVFEGINTSTSASAGLFTNLGSSSSTQTYVKFHRCTIRNGGNYYAWGNTNATYAKTEFEDSHIISSRFVTNDNGTHTDNLYTTISGAASLPSGGFTQETDDEFKHILVPLFPIKDIGAGGATAGTDMHGNTRVNNYGGQQYIAKLLPKYPIVDTGIMAQQDWDGGGGGGGPLVGGLLIGG